MTLQDKNLSPTQTECSVESKKEEEEEEEKDRNLVLVHVVYFCEEPSRLAELFFCSRLLLVPFRVPPVRLQQEKNGLAQLLCNAKEVVSVKL